MDLFGNFFGSSLGISTGTDGSTQLGRSSETWVMGDDIDSTTNRVTLNNHGLSTGDALVYSDGTTKDGGLTDGTTYYAIVIDTDTIQLATSVANANASTAIVLDGAGSDDQSLTVTGDPITIEEVGEAPVGPAGYRTSVEAGAFSQGVDLSTDNTVVVEILDDETGDLVTKTITLGSSDGSVSFSDYMSQLATAANTSFLTEGFTFASAGSDRSYTMTFTPTGGRTVTFSGTSVTQAFGGPVSASGEPSNMDGLTFESMEDVLAELNAQFVAMEIPVVATYSRGADTFNFLVNSGPADASSTIALSGDDLVELGFSGVLASIGGGVDRAEEVRYVSQIDISTRESASLAMTVVDAALETLAGVRGGLGAVANRLESTISNLMNISENTSASMSRVMDADFAAESTRLARAQVLQQASVAMLAQANATAQTVLRLLE
jgi:flagellin